MTRRAPAVAALAALRAALLLGLVASRVAGHLSRNLSRPLSELVGWTETIGRGEPLPEGPPRKGAPEFVVLRNRMREMATRAAAGPRARARGGARDGAARVGAAGRARAQEPADADPVRGRAAAARGAGLARRDDRRARGGVEAAGGDGAQLRAVRPAARGPARAGGPRRAGARGDAQRGAGGDAGRRRRGGRRADGAGTRRRAGARADERAAERGGGERAGSRRSRCSRAARDAGRARRWWRSRCATRACGIPAERLARIWEPYVTHKAGGTGLGTGDRAADGARARRRGGGGEHAGDGTTIRLFLPVESPGAVGMRTCSSTESGFRSWRSRSCRSSAIGWPLARAYARRVEHGETAPRIPADVTARLERMEQAIDSIAVEVERISEGQRFTTKLLAERTAPSAGPGGAPPGS